MTLGNGSDMMIKFLKDDTVPDYQGKIVKEENSFVYYDEGEDPVSDEATLEEEDYDY